MSSPEGGTVEAGTRQPSRPHAETRLVSGIADAVPPLLRESGGGVGSLHDEEQQDRHQEGEDAQTFGQSRADEGAPELAVGRRRIAQRTG